MRRSPALPWLAAALTAVLAVATVVLNALAGAHGDPWWEMAVALAATIGSATVGVLITTQRPGHPIGLLLLANGLLLVSTGLAEAYAAYAVLEDPGALPGAEWAVLWAQSSWPLLYGVVAAITFRFPDGRPPPGRAALAGRLTLGAIGMFVVLSLLDPEPFEAPYEAVDRPLPALPDAAAVLWPVVLLAILAGLVIGVRAVVRRFRGTTGIERLQVRWLAYSAVLVPVSVIICVAASVAAGDDDVAGTFFLFMLGAFPASVGVAVLRHRLYELDRIINRTAVYATLTVLLGAAYAATALVLGTALGRGSAWAAAGATLAVALAFRPLRERVQDAVDRRFSRARYDARRRIAAFLEDLRAGRAAPEDVEPLLREVVEDPSLQLLFHLDGSDGPVDARGRPVASDAGEGREVTPVQRAGVPLGEVLHAPEPDDQPHRLEEVVAAAGLAIEIARLRVELRRRLEEVRASRARIVAAGNEERRRIERDLHDGAQQRLVSIGLALRHAQHQLGPGMDEHRAAIDGAVGEITLAIAELRELAGGVRPSQLDEGLGPALRELARRAPLPVTVAATPERMDADLEAAAYFIACEGLTNAVKHARAKHVTLSAERDNGHLVVAVIDDGVGGATLGSGSGSGLRGLSDRAGAHNGVLRVESVPGAGTRLVADLPCES